MTDPFDALREPVVPTDPDPDFAASLRARIERALALPRGVAVTSTIVEQPPVTAQGAAIPYLAVPVGSGRRALDWYVEVLGARLAGEPIIMEDGRVGHSELAVSGGKLYLSEEFPEIGVVAPSPAGTPVSLSLQVPDVAETLRRAVDSGATMPRAMYDDYGSRNATVVDPFGISSRVIFAISSKFFRSRTVMSRNTSSAPDSNAANHFETTAAFTAFNWSRTDSSVLAPSALRASMSAIGPSLTASGLCTPEKNSTWASSIPRVRSPIQSRCAEQQYQSPVVESRRVSASS